MKIALKTWMRQRGLTVFLCFLIGGSVAAVEQLISPDPVMAHGGRTDSYGCHNQRSDGTYHCHSGPLAGQSFPNQDAMLEALSSVTPTPSVPYDRDLYRHWIDADGDCQDTRQEVLISESLQPVVLDGRGCRVVSGRWFDPYTEQTFTDPGDLDIDHFIPLAEVHRSGGDRWTAQQRKEYANDLSHPNVLIAVSASANRSKGDKDPAQWLPPNLDYRCAYVETWVAVKSIWRLEKDASEEQAIAQVLAECPTTYYFPHLAVGASWQTTITYINYSPEEVTCQTDFLSDYGSPLMVSFAGLGMVVSRTDVLPPWGSVHQESNVDLSALLAPGWAQATCSGPVKASLLFRRRNSEGVPTAEAGVNAAAVPATRFVTFAEQGEGKFQTGVAYVNPSATEALVTFTARDAAGKILASVVRTLLPGDHGAHGMRSLFGLTSFTGSIEVTSTVPIVSLSLNFEADPVFSSLPPGELDASAQ